MVIALHAFTRPWLELYTPTHTTLLAQRIGQNVCSEAEASELPLPFELWLHIAHCLRDFVSTCRLAATCRSLQLLARHPQLWEPRCREAFAARGFAPCDAVLRDFSWSWRKMFMLRPRLRFDGLYFISYQKLMRGTPEGRGMKEKDTDYYSPCGKWAIYYRIFRFFPNGSMFCFLCSAQSPAELRKAVATVSISRPASLNQRLRGACWGSFQLQECGASSNARTVINAVVPLRSEEYPRMKPATIGYEFELRNARAAATNCDCVLTSHCCVYDVVANDIKHFDIPKPNCNFMPFHVSVAKAKEIWKAQTPMAEVEGPSSHAPSVTSSGRSIRDDVA